MDENGFMMCNKCAKHVSTPAEVPGFRNSQQMRVNFIKAKESSMSLKGKFCKTKDIALIKDKAILHLQE